MNLTQILRRVARRFLPQQFGLLTGIFCIIALFSVLQMTSSLMLSFSVSQARENEQRNQQALRQQTKVEEARIALLTASDLLNRAGVYFMQDAATGSEGSWQPLIDEARQALTQSTTAWKAWREINPQADDGLVDSYQRFSGGIQEQVTGLSKTQSIDAFFAVPIQAFQADFNDNYARVQKVTAQERESGRQQLLDRLLNLQHLFLLLPIMLLAILLADW